MKVGSIRVWISKLPRKWRGRLHRHRQSQNISCGSHIVRDCFRRQGQPDEEFARHSLKESIPGQEQQKRDQRFVEISIFWIVGLLKNNRFERYGWEVVRVRVGGAKKSHGDFFNSYGLSPFNKAIEATEDPLSAVVGVQTLFLFPTFQMYKKL